MSKLISPYLLIWALVHVNKFVLAFTSKFDTSFKAPFGEVTVKITGKGDLTL